MISEQVYLGRDNKIDIRLLADDEVQDMAAVTKMELLGNVGGVLTSIDSDNFAGVFNWAGLVPGVVTITLGQVDIDPGTYEFALIVYDAFNTNGIVWGNISIAFHALELV